MEGDSDMKPLELNQGIYDNISENFESTLFKEVNDSVRLYTSKIGHTDFLGMYFCMRWDVFVSPRNYDEKIIRWENMFPIHSITFEKERELRNKTHLI